MQQSRSDWYERGTTEFQPIATKLAAINPDVIDLGGSADADAASVLKEIAILGWDGVKVSPAAAGGEAMVKVGGTAVEDVYMGLAGDFAGPLTTPIQNALDKGLRADIGEPLNIATVSGYDAVMAVKAGMLAANSVEPKDVAAVLPTLVFESSYGQAGFGGKKQYGVNQQILVPIIITQIKDGKLQELVRVSPADLTDR